MNLGFTSAVIFVHKTLYVLFVIVFKPQNL
jgi:hypothetical protein